MIARLPKLFSFEFQQAQRDRLGHTFKPRLERLEDRLSPTVTVTPPADQMSTEGKVTNFSLGSFNDDNPNGNPWTGSVSWGDGGVQPFNVVDRGNLPSLLHRYTEDGMYSVTVTITNSAHETGMGTFNANISDPAVTATAINISTVANTPLTNQPVATFGDPGRPEALTDYSATVDWGDGGGPMPAMITLSGTTFTVSGSHTYTTPNTYMTTVVITHDMAPTVTVMGTATVTPAPLVVTPTGDQVATEGVQGSFTLGSFSDTTSNATSWQVDVNWGDGTAHTVFTVTSQGSLSSQPHTFPEEGSLVVTVTVTDNLGVS